MGELTSVSLPAGAGATGMSATAAGKIRSGVRVPHPRHWEALAAITSAPSQRICPAPQPGTYAIPAAGHADR